MRRAHQEDFAERVSVSWADTDYRAARISNRKESVGFYSDVTEEPSEGQLACGRDPIPMRDPTLYRSDSEGGEDAYWMGVKRCGSVWCCPVCAPRILHRKGELLQELITEHRAQGGEVYLLTATIPHQKGQTTHEVAEAVIESFRFLWRGGPADTWKDRIGLVGKVRALDATFGPNGPHVHVHCLLFTETELETEIEARFLHWAKMRWERKVYSWREYDDGERVLDAFPLNRCLPEDHQPYFGRPHRLKAIQLQKGERAGHYVSELGLGREATRMDVKVGRTGEHLTPQQVLAVYTAAKKAGDEELKRMMAGWWLSWCQAMHGKRHLTGVKRTAEAIDAQVEMFEDEELAEPEDDEEEREKVVEVSRGFWGRLRAHVPHGLADQLRELCLGHDLETVRTLLQGVVGPGVHVALDRDRRRLYSAPP